MSRGATARLFVAVDPPLPVCEELSAWARRAAAAALRHASVHEQEPLRILDPALLHLTLCFLGARPVDEIEELAGAVAECAGGVCELSVGAPVWLPPRRPRSLAVEIHDDDGELARLHARVTAALAGAVAWEPDRRRFRAHVTVARVRGQPSRRRRAPAPDPLPATPQLRFAAESICLYRSWLAPSGASYEAIARRALPAVV